MNKDVEEIFENIRDVVAVHQDDVAAMGKHVAQMKSGFGEQRNKELA